MSDHDPSQSSEHPVSLLLPWYLNGTLSVAQRQEVDEHLQQCRECRNELEALSSLAGKMKSSWANQPAASTELRSRVMSQISKGPVASIPDVRERMYRDRTRPPQRRGRSMLQALAASVIVIQFAAILWMMRAPQPEVISRGIASGFTQIQIVFQPAATEADIRAVVVDLHARIVDGPDARAAYTLQLPNDKPAETGKQLAALGRRKELVQRIELAAP